jgi:hypothetical protein
VPAEEEIASEGWQCIAGETATFDSESVSFERGVIAHVQPGKVPVAGLSRAHDVLAQLSQ